MYHTNVLLHIITNPMKVLNWASILINRNRTYLTNMNDLGLWQGYVTVLHKDTINDTYIYFLVSNYGNKQLPSSLWYKTHFGKQLDCWSLRCSWSIVCRRCSNYIFILNLTPGFNGLGKGNYKMRRDAFNFLDLVRLILDTLLYIPYVYLILSSMC